MKFQKSTLILMFLALFMGGIVYTWETEGRPYREAVKAKENLLFDFQEKDVQSVVLKTKNQTLQFERNLQNNQDRSAPKWLLKIVENTTETESAKDPKATASPEAKSTESANDPKATASPEAKPTESANDPKATTSPEAKPTESANDPKATTSPEAKSTESANDPKATTSPEAKPTESANDPKATTSPEAKPTESANDPKATTSPEAKPTESANEAKQLIGNEAYVSYLLNLLSKAKGDRIIADPRIKDGLDNPLATVEIKLNNKQTHQLILGNSNFNNTSLYALADPAKRGEESLKLVLVPTDFKYAVDRPLSEWKQQEQQKETTTPNSDKSSTNNSQKDEKEKPDKEKAN